MKSNMLKLTARDDLKNTCEILPIAIGLQLKSKLLYIDEKLTSKQPEICSAYYKLPFLCLLFTAYKSDQARMAQRNPERDLRVTNRSRKVLQRPE